MCVVISLSWDFRSGTPYLFGQGSFRKLGEHLPEGDCLLVCGRSSARKLGLVDHVKEAIKGELHTFEEVEPNPLDTTVDMGAELLEEVSADYILAVGGGSVIDAAKVIDVVATGGELSRFYMNGSREVPGMSYPLIAVPTTPGTSSEITPFAVLTVPSMKNKVGLRNPYLYPDFALIDPELTKTLPKNQTVATGLDILSHAFESYWAKKANPVTRKYSLDSVKLVRKHLEGAIRNGNDSDHRSGISLSSVYAGLSFSNTGTTICHAISYPITMDTGLPHGLACAMSLPETFDILVEKKAHGMEDLAEAFGSEIRSLSSDLRQFLISLDSPTNVKEGKLHVSKERILDTDLDVLKKNLCIEITDSDVSRIIDSIE